MKTPTVPEMLPNPIEPDLAVETVEYIGLKVCVYADSMTLVTPPTMLVAHTLVGYAGIIVVVVATVWVRDWYTCARTVAEKANKNDKSV